MNVNMGGLHLQTSSFQEIVGKTKTNQKGKQISTQVIKV